MEERNGGSVQILTVMIDDGVVFSLRSECQMLWRQGGSVKRVDEGPTCQSKRTLFNMSRTNTNIKYCMIQATILRCYIQLSST